MLQEEEELLSAAALLLGRSKGLSETRGNPCCPRNEEGPQQKAAADMMGAPWLRILLLLLQLLLLLLLLLLLVLL